MGLFGPSKPDIATLKANRDLPGLIKALNYGGTDTKANEIREAAALALGEIGDSVAVEPLIAAHAQAATRVKQVAANTDGSDRIAYSLTLLRAMNAAGEMHRSIAVALAKIGDPRAVGVLIDALKSESQSVREAAAEALGEMGDPQAIEPLVAARDNEELANDNVAAALSKLGAPPAPKS